MDKSPTLEAVKEIVRLAIFAAAAAFVTALLGGLEALNSNEIWVMVATGALRFLDKLIHENKNIKSKGLLPF